MNARIALDKLGPQAVVREPFPHLCVDDILDAQFAQEVWAAFPSYQEARQSGREFATVNEKRKIQITDFRKFPAPIRELHELLADDAFIAHVGRMFGIKNLLADPDLSGGGIHETNSGGRLDVHIDFNFLKEKQWHRRVNLLFYFNKDWKEEWGGYLDLWDKDVKQRCGYYAPRFNRMAGFATGTQSWHGVTPVACPEGRMRQSFAVYYYTKEPPPGWDGQQHSTVFKARPDEWMKGNVAMPAEAALRGLQDGVRGLKRGVKSLIGRQ